MLKEQHPVPLIMFSINKQQKGEALKASPFCIFLKLLKEAYSSGVIFDAVRAVALKPVAAAVPPYSTKVSFE